MPARPAAAGLAPPGEDSPEQVARDVLETGVEIRAKRRWWFGTRKLDALEAAEKLREGKRPLQVVVGGVTLPLLSEQDLTEVAVFSHLRPVQLLPHAETAEQLQALEKLGPTFLDSKGRNVGGYGAYNALTDPAHVQDVSLQVGDQRLALELSGLPGLAAFYQKDTLGQLELQGYQFFDKQNQRRPAYGSSDPSQVGKNGQVWLSTSTPGLPDELARFDRHYQDTRNLTAARELYQLNPTAAEIQRLTQTYGEGVVMPGILREMAPLATPDLVALGQQLKLGPQGCKLFLESLQARPEAAPAATVGLRALEGLQSVEACTALLQEVLKLPPVTTGVEVSRLLKSLSDVLSAPSRDYYRGNDLNALGRSSLALLADFPDTRPGAERVNGWQPGLPIGPVRKLLENPTASSPAEMREVAAGCQPGDSKLRQAVLKELQADPATAANASRIEKALARCRYEPSQNALFLACLKCPEEKQTLELVRAVMAGLPAGTDYNADVSRLETSPIILEILQELPSTRAAAQRLAAWKPARPFGPVQALLKNPTDASPQNLRRVALGLELSDHEAQKLVLDEWKESAGARIGRAVFDACYDSRGKHVAFRTALQIPDLKNGQEAARMLEIMARRMERGNSPYKSNNLNGLGTAAIQVLQQFPDTQVAAARVAGWKSSSPAGVGRALVRNPVASSETELRQLALGADAHDATLQKSVLAELQADPAAAAAAEFGLSHIDQFYSPAGKQALFQSILRHPRMTTGPEAVTLHKAILTQIDSVKDPYQGNSQAILGAAILETLQQFPETRAGATQLAAWKPAQPYGVARALLDHPGVSTRQECLALALQGTPGDTAFETRVMDELASDSSVALLRPAYDTTYGGVGKTMLFRAALTHPDARDAAQTTTLLRTAFKLVEETSDAYKDNALQALGGVALRGLVRHPETQAGAEKILTWKPSRPAALARKLLESPEQPDLLEVALACDPNDNDFQKNRLAELPDAAQVVPLYDRFYSQQARHCLFQTRLTRPDPKTGSEVAAWLAETADRLGQTRDTYLTSSQTTLAQYALEALATHPDTRPAAERVAGWNLRQPYPAVRELLKTPAGSTRADLLRYARLIDPGDAAAQLKVLEDLDTPVSRLSHALLGSAYSAPARQAAYQLGLSDRSLASGAEARELLKELDQELQKRPESYEKTYDAQGFARAVAPALSTFPDTRAVAEKVVGWGPQTSYETARILLENPDALNRKAFDQGFLVEGNREREQALLAELAQDARTEKAAAIARVSCDQVQQPNTRHALVLAALTVPEIRCSEDVDAYFQLAGQLSRRLEPDKLKDLNEIYRTGFGLGRKAGLGLAEEEQRVLVGGVVVKKR